jgi:hypothetical protein
MQVIDHQRQRRTPASIALVLFAALTLVAVGYLNLRTPRTAETAPERTAPARPDTSGRTLSDQHFTVALTTKTDRADATALLNILNNSRREMNTRLTAAKLPTDQVPRLEIILYPSTGDFTAATGQPWWAAAATQGSRLHLQPLDVLRNRGVLESTVRHEYAHAVIESIGGRRTPRWLAEGMAISLAGEGARYAALAPPQPLAPEEIDRRLAAASTPEQMQAAYSAAYQAVQDLIKTKTETGVWRQISEQ